MLRIREFNVRSPNHSGITELEAEISLLPLVSVSIRGWFDTKHNERCAVIGVRLAVCGYRCAVCGDLFIGHLVVHDAVDNDI